jgi:hypothetical protein
VARFRKNAGRRRLRGSRDTGRRKIPPLFEHAGRRARFGGGKKQQVAQGRVKILARHQLDRGRQQVNVFPGNVSGEVDDAFGKPEQREKVQMPGAGLPPVKAQQPGVGIKQQTPAGVPAKLKIQNAEVGWV